MQKIFSKFNTKNNQGFVLLYTVLIASIILAIALGIANISYQEVVLSSSAKDGNIAFFAADTGAECALYWDLNKRIFENSNNASISCASSNISAAVGAQFNLDLNNGANCAKVTIFKDSPAGTGQTQIESLGYNASCASLNPASGVVNPRLVERAIRVTY